MTQIVLELVASIVAAGALVPLLVSLVIQSHWRKRWRTLAMLAVTLLSGAATYFVDHKLTGADLHDPSKVVTVVVGVLLASAAAYRVLWKPSGVTDGIEKATSKTTAAKRAA